MSTTAQAPPMAAMTDLERATANLEVARERARLLPDQREAVALALDSGRIDRGKAIQRMAELNAEAALLPMEAEHAARRRMEIRLAEMHARHAAIQAEIARLSEQREKLRTEGQAAIDRRHAQSHTGEAPRFESLPSWYRPKETEALLTEFNALGVQVQDLANERDALTQELSSTWGAGGLGLHIAEPWEAWRDRCAAAIHNYARNARAELKEILNHG